MFRPVARISIAALLAFTGWVALAPSSIRAADATFAYCATKCLAANGEVDGEKGTMYLTEGFAVPDGLESGTIKDKFAAFLKRERNIVPVNEGAYSVYGGFHDKASAEAARDQGAAKVKKEILRGFDPAKG